MATLRQRAHQERDRWKHESADASRRLRPLPFEIVQNEDNHIVLDRILHELTPILPAMAPKKLVAIGINAVTRFLERHQACVVVLAMNASVQSAAWHIMSMANTFAVPIIVLDTTSQALGTAVGLKSASAVALAAAPTDTDDGEQGHKIDSNVLKQYVSITAYLQSKQSAALPSSDTPSTDHDL
ncbi:hypothetical protein H310_03376 [Aphanomyces invadans]|uniref:Ribosomal protein eL8/eL30/eS12/Gadd45 domain-containing protein n=1 Tax=Aphanomyces invadans TaxID=157072 RepID=A0A024UGU4_9STRA|nr:hypothetical protein H310_03376 [Aphanomyces invadans]ETW05651.1 hypothetical protein H310_03376 [Aphanomyces invadans]|eukprot:XP_008865428.1 hypothetical protein H310_03376 [Aphanomyces invadans]